MTSGYPCSVSINFEYPSLSRLVEATISLFYLLSASSEPLLWAQSLHNCAVPLLRLNSVLENRNMHLETTSILLIWNASKSICRHYLFLALVSY